MTSHRHKVRGARCAAREEGSAGGWILPKPLFWCFEEGPGFAIDKMISRLRRPTTTKFAESSLVQPLALNHLSFHWK